MKALTLATILLTLSGCHSLASYRKAETVFAAVEVDYDERRGALQVSSPVVWYDSALSKCHLRTLISRDGSRTNQLYVVPAERRRGPIFRPTGRAIDRAGNDLKTRVIDVRINAHWVSVPHVAVELTDEYLENSAVSGIDIRLIGKRGRTVVRLPAHYVRGFVDKLHVVIQNAPMTVLASR